MRDGRRALDRATTQNKPWHSAWHASLLTCCKHSARKRLRHNPDLRAVLKGLLGLDARRIETSVFPDSTDAKSLRGLFA